MLVMTVIVPVYSVTPDWPRAVFTLIVLVVTVIRLRGLEFCESRMS